MNAEEFSQIQIPLGALQKTIAYHPIFREITGSMNSAILLSQFYYWNIPSKKGEDKIRFEDGWFYKTQAGIEEETGLTRYEMEASRKKLVALGIIEHKRKGQPARTWYKMDMYRLAELITTTYQASTIQIAENQQSRLRKNHKLDCGEPPNLNNTENTTESKTEKLPPSGGDESYENPFNLYEAMCNQLGIPVEALPRPQMMKQLGVAKRLAKSGVTSTDVKKITAWLQSQSWLTSGIDMLVVDKNYAKWILSGKTGAKPTSSKAPVITEDDPYQVRAYLGNGPWEIGTDEHGEPIFTSDLRTYYEHKFPEAL